ncbi:hypothetical protein AB0F11_14095 [Streptomyces sp. NPDC032472]|uniref:hypothetical protein n=1 Tax=Streptomyces sp. NPDC032472 TaxID=3155018 RepID=UPI00340DC138
MTTTDERVSEITKALAHREWVPSETEQAVGALIVRKRQSLMGHLDQQPMTGRSKAEGLRLQQDLADQVARESLPAARELLGRSLMVELIEAYVDTLRAMAPYADKLRPLLEAGGESLTEYDVLTPAEREKMQDVWTAIIAAGSVLGAAVTGDVD